MKCKAQRTQSSHHPKVYKSKKSYCEKGTHRPIGLRGTAIFQKGAQTPKFKSAYPKSYKSPWQN